MNALSVVFVASLLAGQNTGSIAGLFDSTSKDFGNVPYGSTTVHTFRVRNTTKSHLKISTLRSSCHCAIPSAMTFDCAPGQELAIKVEFHAQTFTGPKSMTIFVSFIEPHLETVELRVNGFSRQDITFSPGEIEFGALKKGDQPTKSTTLDFTGSQDFKVTGVEKTNFVDVKVDERSRSAGRVRYEVVATLRDRVPAGMLTETVRMKTNDPKTPTIQFQVTASIEAKLLAAPSFLDLGTLKVNEKIQKRVVLKADRPFSLVSWSGQTEGVDVQVTQGSKTVHILNIEFSGTKTGKIAQEIRFRTDLAGEEPLPFRIFADIQ